MKRFQFVVTYRNGDVASCSVNAANLADAWVLVGAKVAANKTTEALTIVFHKEY
jgi:hypothetical protein